jgi:hypothetical protein
MAEIFGAVASGAGLISLALQLLESSQKLRAFCNASKDAPEVVGELGYELETMSLSLFASLSPIDEATFLVTSYSVDAF